MPSICRADREARAQRAPAQSPATGGCQPAPRSASPWRILPRWMRSPALFGGGGAHRCIAHQASARKMTNQQNCLKSWRRPRSIGRRIDFCTCRRRPRLPLPLENTNICMNGRMCWISLEAREEAGLVVEEGPSTATLALRVYAVHPDTFALLQSLDWRKSTTHGRRQLQAFKASPNYSARSQAKVNERRHRAKISVYGGRPARRPVTWPGFPFPASFPAKLLAGPTSSIAGHHFSGGGSARSCGRRLRIVAVFSPSSNPRGS